MKKTILIFGGGPNQLTLIRASKEMNLNTVVIDPFIDAPGKELADHFLVISPDDYEGTRQVAIDFSADAIVTSQMENPLLLMARLAEDLGFIFPGVQQVKNCRNKYLMKQVLMKNNIPCARGIVLSQFEPVTPIIISPFPLPLIIKPVDSHSSRGVFLIHSLDEMLKFEDMVRSFSGNGELMIEEYITGKEFSVESLTYKGRTEIIQITEKFITPGPYTVEMGHLQPAPVAEKEKEIIHDIVKNTIASFELDNCATHAELKLTDNGPVIIEIAARLGGDYISSLLTLTSTGINMDESLIRISLGEAPMVTPASNNYAFIKYLELKAGSKVKKILNWQEILEEEGVVHVQLTIKEQQVIPEITDSAKRPGFVLVSGRSRDDVLQKADFYLNRLKEYIILN